MMFWMAAVVICRCRAPRGARGLKFAAEIVQDEAWRSRPTRGAWIEIMASAYRDVYLLVAPHAGRVD